MGDKSAIEWTDATWNPVTGCSKVSPGCDHCYAEAPSLRYGWSKKPWAPENAKENVILRPDRLDAPRHWRKPRMVFVNSMSDMFHPLVPGEYIARVFDTMQACAGHTFQILTKRPKRMRDWCWRYQPEPLSNVWLGTSIESREHVHRADAVRETPAAVRFISAEPLLGPLVHDSATASTAPSPLNAYGLPGACTIWGDGYDGAELDLTDIDWLIVGGESGPRHRPVDPQWVRDLRHTAPETGTAFFFKQWGGRTPKAGGRELDGRTYDEMPACA